MIALRTNDDIHRSLAPEDFLPFGLRDAARDNDFGLPPARGARGLNSAQLPQLRKHFFGGTLADMASVQNNNISFFQPIGLGIAFRARTSVILCVS